MDQKKEYKASAIANFFLKKEGHDLTVLKLLKIVYIGFGWSAALLDRYVFDEPIEAWKYGPVVPSLYHEFKHLGDKIIETKASESDWEQNFKVEYPEVLEEDASLIDILNQVWKGYSSYTAPQLVEITHRENTPWFETYDGSFGKVIPNEKIKLYYQRLSNE